METATESCAWEVRVVESGPSDAALLARYREVRQATEALCDPLSTEDFVVQSIPETSPTKWHLAHTSRFFERHLLEPYAMGYRPFDRRFGQMFDTAQVGPGERRGRPLQRGLWSRPTLDEVFAYRRHVDGRMEELLDTLDETTWRRVLPVTLLGIHHEQRHQELIVADIKHAFWQNPLRPAYRIREEPPRPVVARASWIAFPEGLRQIGAELGGFAFDHEGPRHTTFVPAYQLSSRLATNAELAAFVEDGGYARPDLWFPDGWQLAQANGWQAPLYWEREGGRLRTFTLSGMAELEPDQPACHLSFFEADAFARWSHARLQTEVEWETAATDLPVDGNFLEEGLLHPVPARIGRSPGAPAQIYGDVWEWSNSPFAPYPGFRPSPGLPTDCQSLFASNQMTLRGGSCATPRSHLRASYRHALSPGARWQFTGVRLARDA